VTIVDDAEAFERYDDPTNRERPARRIVVPVRL
jgi:hypothetical protein